MTAAIKLQTIALWEQAKAFLATPIGWISVVLGLCAAITTVTDAWQKQVETAQEALEVNKENIQQYQSELDSLEQLQKKLEEAQGDKKALAAIQGELNNAIGETVGLLNGEAEAYKIATVNLQAQINAKKQLIAQEQQDAVNNNKEIFDNQGIKKSFLGIDWLATDRSGDKLREAAKEISKRQDKYGMDYNDAFNSIARNYGITREEWDKYWNEQVSTAYSVFQQTIDNYDGFGGSTFIQKVIESGVRGGKSLDEIQKMLNEISSNDIQPLVNEYIASLDNPDVDSESLYNNIIKKLDEIKKKYPELATLIDGYSKDLVNDIDNVSSSLEEAETSFKSIAKTLSDGLDKLSNKKDILSEVKEELDSFGAISADNISKILERFSDNEGVQEAVAYYLSGLGTAQQVYDAMAKGYQDDLKAQAKEIAVKMQNDEKYYNALKKINGGHLKFQVDNYSVDLSKCKDLATAKLEVENQLIKTLKTNWGNYYKSSSASLDDEIKRAYDKKKHGGHADPEFMKYWNELLATRDARDKVLKELDNLTIDKFDTSKFNEILDTDFGDDFGEDSGSKTNETAEDRIEYYKHRHEMGIISEATYYKKLEAIRKKYYAGKKDYLDRDRELQEEYHNWEISKAQKTFDAASKPLIEDYIDGKIKYADFKKKYKKLIKDVEKVDKDEAAKLKEEASDVYKEARLSKMERRFDDLEYKKEYGFVTDKQYLKKYFDLTEEYYGYGLLSAEEYAENIGDIYDGFKDMYKEDLEADKKTWEEKKEAVSEYYDELIEKIQDAHDEEDYEKEQSEKRKEIFDLDMQIAELMRDGSEKAKARIAELEEERLQAEEDLLDFETDKAREDEIKRLEKEKEKREKEIQDKIDNIDVTLSKLDSNTKDIRDTVIQYAKAKGVDIKFACASGTRSSVGGIGRINEKGIEMISAPDGNGNYIPMLPSSYVFSAKATEFLWKLATEHSLPQAMYNSIAKSIKTQSNTPSVNIAQPINITMGDIIVKGNADKQTVADIKKQQENTVRMVLQKIKELQK